MVSKKEYCTTEKSFKYFIGYIDNDDIRPLCIKLPQMMGYVKKFDSTDQCYLRLRTKHFLKCILKHGEN